MCSTWSPPLSERLRGGSCLGPNEGAWWCFDTKHVSVGDVNVLSSQIVQNNMGLYVTGLSP